MWIKMMESYSTHDKLKLELENAGYKIYRRCDEQARYILDEARSSGQLDLKGDNDKYPNSSKLFEQIINLIATESIPEKTSRNGPRDPFYL